MAAEKKTINSVVEMGVKHDGLGGKERETRKHPITSVFW